MISGLLINWEPPTITLEEWQRRDKERIKAIQKADRAYTKRQRELIKRVRKNKKRTRR